HMPDFACPVAHAELRSFPTRALPICPRLAAANALALVMAGKASLGTSLPGQLKQVVPRDHALTQELAFGTARWFFRLDALANRLDRKSTRLNSSHVKISYAVFCLKKK